MTTEEGPLASATEGNLQPANRTGRRRSDRVSLSLPIEVFGTDLSGRDFIQKATTKHLARYGGSMTIDAALAPEQSVTVRLLGGHAQQAGDREAEVRVVGQVGLCADGHVYGFAFQDDKKATFWGIYFPPLRETEDFLTKAVLECGSCHRREIVALNEIEFDVFEANDRLTRDCADCKESTVWKQAAFEKVERGTACPTLPGELTSRQTAPVAEAEAPAPSWPAVDLRRAPRIKVNLKGCILVGDEKQIVSVHDISRGGIRFHVQCKYGIDLWVQVAVPYTIAGANMFRPGRIVWRKERGVAAFEYGLKFVRN